MRGRRRRRRRGRRRIGRRRQSFVVIPTGPQISTSLPIIPSSKLLLEECPLFEECPLLRAKGVCSLSRPTFPPTTTYRHIPWALQPSSAIHFSSPLSRLHPAAAALLSASPPRPPSPCPSSFSPIHALIPSALSIRPVPPKTPVSTLFPPTTISCRPPHPCPAGPQRATFRIQWFQSDITTDIALLSDSTTCRTRGSPAKGI